MSDLIKCCYITEMVHVVTLISRLSVNQSSVFFNFAHILYMFLIGMFGNKHYLSHVAFNMINSPDLFKYKMTTIFFKHPPRILFHSDSAA